MLRRVRPQTPVPARGRPLGVGALAGFAIVFATMHACGTSSSEPPLALQEIRTTPAEPEVVQVEPEHAEPDAPPEAAAAPGTPEPEPEPEQNLDPLHGEVGEGDSLSKILHRAGVPASTVASVVVALEPVMDPTTIRVGQRFAIELDDGGELAKLAFWVSATEIVSVARDDEEKWRASTEDLPTHVVEEEIHGVVESSLWAAMAEAGNAAALVDVVVDVFAYDIDFFTATRKGDEFRLVVERHEIDGELVRYGRVLAAEYAGEKESALVLWWPGGKGEAGRYVDAEGRGVARTLLKTPLKYSRISSGFSPARMHPVLHRVKSHRGVDYAAPEGTPVWAAADGTITFRGEKGGAGNLVVLKHAGGLTTQYMHLSKFRDGQRVGEKVTARTVIGYVGSTGLATGPHLHFGVLKKGVHVDPTKLESVRQPGVPAAHRRAFDSARDEWRDRLARIGQTGTDSAP